MHVCKECVEGKVIVGENIVTRDMAIDAGDRQLEGMFLGYEQGTCPCCNGAWQDCENCKNEAEGVIEEEPNEDL